MVSTHAYKNFQLALQGHTYSTDVMLLPLGDCDMVLGIQWLTTLGNIQWNFKELTMTFKCEGDTRILQGISQTHVKWISEKQCVKVMNQPKGTLAAMTLLCFFNHIVPNGTNTIYGE